MIRSFSFLVSILFLFILIGFCQAALPEEFEEKSLSFYAGSGGEAYRVSIEPFGDSPLMVRVVFDGKNYILTAKQLSGEGLYYLGTLVSTWQAILSTDQWKRFRTRVDQASFWSKQSHVKELAITDGANYWIEGYKDGRALCLDRHCVGSLPEDKGLEIMATYFLKFYRDRAILRRNSYYSSPISTADGTAIFIGTAPDYRTKH